MSESNTRLASFRKGEDLAVDVSAIEKELTSLWKAAAQDEVQNTTRACLWNLVVHSPDYESSDALRNQLEEIYPSVPMRTLLLEIESGAEPPLSAWVSARCHFTGKGKQVCSEEVTIRCQGDNIAKLPQLVSALLVPDVPAAAWWPDLTHDPKNLVEHFTDTLDRVVLDSSTAPGATGLTVLQTLAGLRRAGRQMLGDLSWHRVAPWRSLLARLFDHRAAMVDLHKVDSVHIEVVGRAGQAAGSPVLLLSGWLASCLGWTPVDEKSWRRPDGGTVTLHIEHTRGGRRHDITSLALQAGDHRFEISREGDLLRSGAPHLGDSVGSFLRLRHITDAQLLQRELGPMGEDPLMWNAIDHALTGTRDV